MFSSVLEAVAEIKAGRMVVVVDDEDRENEGDLTLAAEFVTPEAINFMARFGRYVLPNPRWVCCGNVLDVDLVGKYGCPNCLGGNKPKPRWANQTDSGQNKLTPGPDRWKERARTYSGWAEAMAAQWSALP